MGVMRAIITLPSVTGLPENDFVNVMHFANSDNAGLIGPNISAFFNTVPTGGNLAVGEILSTEVSRAAVACSVDFYDLADPEPRTPFAFTSWTMATQADNRNFPAEAAICVSWLAAVESGVPAGRRRGRNFIGPLNIAAGTLTGVARPLPARITDIALAAEQFLDACIADGSPLVIYSGITTTPPAQPAPVAREVVGGYVDNAFDTMRKRGPDTTDRTLFSTS